jgi:hypothetical protein
MVGIHPKVLPGMSVQVLKIVPIHKTVISRWPGRGSACLNSFVHYGVYIGPAIGR